MHTVKKKKKTTIWVYIKQINVNKFLQTYQTTIMIQMLKSLTIYKPTGY